MLQAALPEALADALAAGQSGRSFSSRLGRELHKRIDTRYGLWHLEFMGNDSRSGTAQYRVDKELDPTPDADNESQADTGKQAESESTEESKGAERRLADFADFSPTPLGFSQNGFTERGYTGGENSVKSAKSADQSGSGFTPNRDILNATLVDGTAALQPKTVQVGIPAEPVDIEAERERRSDPKRQAITPAILSGAYRGTDWFNPEADKPAYLQALLWACGNNPARIKAWSVPVVVNAFKDNGVVGALEWRNEQTGLNAPLTAKGFARELQSAYRFHNHKAIYKMAKTLGVDVKMAQ